MLILEVFKSQKPDLYSHSAGVQEKCVLLLRLPSPERPRQSKAPGALSISFLSLGFASWALAPACMSVSNGVALWGVFPCSCHLCHEPEDPLPRAMGGAVLRGRVWAPTRLRRVLVRPQSSGREKPKTDQKEVEATGRRGGWDAWLFSEDYSDSTTTTKAGFIASCIIGKANSDGRSYPLQFSCLSFAFRIDYPARKDFCCRDF